MNDLAPEGAPSNQSLQPGVRTLRDVARLAGVSIGAASKALNASGRLSAETRAKVSARRERSTIALTTWRRACIARAP